jgi:multidrug transporter EmrE-like cation transporter
MTYVLILFSVCLSAFSQVILRYGMTRADVAEALAGGASALQAIGAIARSPFVIGGLACYGLGAVVWLLVLSRIPVSHAYPFVSLGIVLTALAGVIALGESISLTACLGILLIVSGILCIAVGR